MKRIELIKEKIITIEHQLKKFISNLSRRQIIGLSSAGIMVIGSLIGFVFYQLQNDTIESASTATKNQQRINKKSEDKATIAKSNDKTDKKSTTTQSSDKSDKKTSTSQAGEKSENKTTAAETQKKTQDVTQSEVQNQAQAAAQAEAQRQAQATAQAEAQRQAQAAAQAEAQRQAQAAAQAEAERQAVAQANQSTTSATEGDRKGTYDPETGAYEVDEDFTSGRW